jgi:hypothetical protein
MKDTQFVILESGPVCNLAAKHPKCPSFRRGALGRLDEGMMISIGSRMYNEFGFAGMIGFHYLNEPTLEIWKIWYVMEGIRHHARRAKFVLWTNGTEPARMTGFDKVFVTNYYQTWQDKKNGHTVVEVNFDDRLNPRLEANLKPCARMFNEFIVDCDGNVRLCCQRPHIIGNVYEDSLESLVRAYKNYRMGLWPEFDAALAPLPCFKCTAKLDRIERLI